MKKIYFFAAIFSLSTAAFAQKAHLPGEPKTGFQPSSASAETPTDTLWGNFFNGSPTIYGSQNGGYVVGVNGYGDEAKAQMFIANSGAYAVEGALVWFGGKDNSSGNAGSKVTVNYYTMNGTGTTTAGSGPAPGTVVSSVDLLITDVDTTAGNINAVTFSSPIAVMGDYAIGVDFTTLAGGDTVGIVSTADGDAGGAELSWEKWSDNSWYTMLQAWPLDIDFAIFPVVDMNAAGIEDMGYINGIKLGQNQPNPFNSTSVISYELENNSEVTLVIYDLTGKLVQSIEAGSKMAGKHSIEINSDKLAAGTYYYVLKTGNSNGIARKMVVGK